MRSRVTRRLEADVHARLRATGCAVALAGLGAALLVPFAGGGAEAATAAAVSINPPGNPVAGQVTLSGTAGAEGGQTTSVLYAFDATNSTATPDRSDCSGDGAVDAADDLNGDGAVGDVLDCEIAGVVSLNRSLVGGSSVQAGVVGFANQAAAADLDPGADAPAFTPVGFTGGDARPRVESVARSVVRGAITQYTPKDLGGSGSGTAFDSALQTSLATLASAPAGPKYVMLLSDGQSPVDDALLQQLTTSGVKVRTFAVGADASCVHYGSLAKIASATGESCTSVGSPADLTAQLSASQPDAVSGVSVSIGKVAVAAQVNAVGGWRADFVLGEGTYTAIARATLTSGATATTRSTFSVAPTAAGPAPGTVGAGAGALRATGIVVARPGATKAPSAAHVTGRVGVVRGTRVKSAAELAGTRVLLQVRRATSDAWTTVDRDRIDQKGLFALRWRPKAQTPLLRVALEQRGRFASSAVAVPEPPVSACSFSSKHGTHSVTCRTTARNGAQVRLLDDGTVVDRSRVREHTFRVTTRGSLNRTVVVVGSGSGRATLVL
ncbi:VWA domain-containing protein [Nocardioides anomalus]|uniref:VWA domain-containing protein n=1 Tax=Nocardioides anomalus TaxID=2712223 RepID=A0A6G6WK18_9ACTN|nr:vWA domain-containing protein [Nocardioides anomalus]QIG45584.1 VWA domain-containing protein [Nocardioides anomalus]